VQSLGRNAVKNTVCVSSQIGCQRTCDHCCSGARPFHRNLTCDELLGQVAAFAVSNEIHQVAFQGMGEPLDNPAVGEAAHFLTTRYQKLRCTCGDADADVACQGGDSAPLVCVSTIGNSQAIRDLAAAAPSSYLNVSLTPIPGTDRPESALDVLRSTDDFAAQTGRRVALSYTMIEGLDTEEHLAILLEQMRGRRETHAVNLVQYHADFGGEQASKPSCPATIREFLARLREYGCLANFGQYCEFPHSLLSGEAAPPGAGASTAV